MMGFQPFFRLGKFVARRTWNYEFEGFYNKIYQGKEYDAAIHESIMQVQLCSENVL